MGKGIGISDASFKALMKIREQVMAATQAYTCRCGYKWETTPPTPDSKKCPKCGCDRKYFTRRGAKDPDHRVCLKCGKSIPYSDDLGPYLGPCPSCGADEGFEWVYKNEGE